MNKIIIIVLLLSVNLGFAQNYSEHYYKRKALFERTPDSEDEIIFLGNSITEGGDWKALFPNKNVINRGISGDVTDGILFRLNEVTTSKPAKIFLLIGTNDLAREKSIDYVVNGCVKIIKQIQKDSKGTSIYVQSILPVNPNVGKRFSGHKSNKEAIVMANTRLKVICFKYGIKFINLHKAFRNNKGELKAKYTHDGLHLSNKGYIKWKKVVNKYVK